MTGIPSELHPLAAALEGQYEFIREIGRGGMGIVYLARDLKLARQVAIKTLPPHLGGDPTIRERFLREARTAAALSHANIVPIHRADELAGSVFFVMGYVDGEPLAQLIRRDGRLTARQTLPLLRDVVLALGYAHRLGVVHRDIKGENIIVERLSGRAMVTDFGIARLMEAAPLTATGTVLGTVHFMSPEQVSGDAVDGRSDFYSLGVLAFQALTGRFPFEHPSASAVLVAHVTQAAPLVQAVAPDVPAPAGLLVDRLLRKPPSARYQTAEELVSAIDEAMAQLAASGADARPLVLSATEAHAVWERAAQLQDYTGQAVPPARPMPVRSGPPPTSGYQVDIARDAAREAGIAPKYFDRAMDERMAVAAALPQSPGMARPGITSGPNAFLGEATTISYEAIVDGEMPERDFDVIVEIIRRTMSDAGQVSAVGRSLIWTSSEKGRKVSVSVLVRGGRTSIHVAERLKDLAGGLFGGIIGGGGGGMIGPAIAVGTQVFQAGPVGIAAALVLNVGTMYGLARTIYTHITRGRRRVLHALCDRLANQARESMQQALAPGDRHLPR